MTLAESCISGPGQPLGAVVQVSRDRLRKDAVLFGESQSRAVISSKPAHRQAILDQARRFGVPAEMIGSVAGTRLTVHLRDGSSTESVIDQPVTALYDQWACSLERAVHQA